MLVESRAIRDLLNAPVIQGASSDPESLYSRDFQRDASLQIPKSYMFSMNPIPALMVLLLGLMMNSHHQASMVSTMVHKQWGNLLVGAAFARTLTYIIFFLSPPISILPSRPPSELLTAFCLMAGGLVFMASVSDPTSWMCLLLNFYRLMTRSQQWNGMTSMQCLFSPFRWGLSPSSWRGSFSSLQSKAGLSDEKAGLA